MTEKIRAPFGTWHSPFNAQILASQTIGLGQLAFDGSDAYWLESRPSEAGRNVIMRRSRDGHISEINPAPFNARSRVHEYGGGSYAVAAGLVVFSDFSDQCLYCIDGACSPQALTEPGPYCYADMLIDLKRRRIICIREDHSTDHAEPVNTLVSIALDGGVTEVLAQGNDFYASPALSPDGEQLVWLSWNHSDMPWDNTELWLATLDAHGRPGQAQCVAGGSQESVFQPQWSPNGQLYYVSDRSGWWNLYRLRDNVHEPVLPMEAEFGLPQWVFGMSTYAFESHKRLFCSYCIRGDWHLAYLDTHSLQWQTLDLPYTDISGLRAVAGQALFIAGSPTAHSCVLLLDTVSGGSTCLQCASDLAVDTESISTAQPMIFPSSDGQMAHAYFYAPRNRDYAGVQGEKPPLLVKTHGGPTAATRSNLNMKIQYWTSRGFAVLDVNYGGSTGYGRRYRERLAGQWGIVDVDDCVNGANDLVQRGEVDGERLLISGGSAGGYTTLCALTFRECFRAGASYYGISDLEALVRDTHKFEARYLDRLIGPYPQAKATYQQRSPIHYTEQLSCPIVFFQGLEDKVVPPNQAESMVQALRVKGLPVAYVTFEGEQHGFRQAQHIQRTMEAELLFYARVFGFKPADAIEPIKIENLAGMSG